MAQVTAEGFIVIDEQVAMPEETLCKLLNITPEKIENLVKFVGMKYIRGGIYFRDGKYYFASPQVVLRMAEANGTSSECLTQRQVYELFEAAEERLLLRVSDEKLKKVRNSRARFDGDSCIFNLTGGGFFDIELHTAPNKS